MGDWVEARAGSLSQYVMTAVVVVSDINSQRDHKTYFLEPHT